MHALDGAAGMECQPVIRADAPTLAATDCAAAAEITHRGVLGKVARRALPHLIEATIVPAVLFYTCLLAFGLWVAFYVALTWSYGALVHRIVSRRGIPPILVLSTVALTVRTAIALASGSGFVYFFQPVLGTVAMAGVFMGSLMIGQPLVEKLAADFWPLQPEVAAHPAVRRLFRGLTMLWAGVNLALAGATFLLLVTLPVEGFVPAKMLSGYLITGTGIVITVTWSITTARREGLVLAATALS